MPTLPFSGRRYASARRTLFAALTAAALVAVTLVVHQSSVLTSAQVKRGTVSKPAPTPAPRIPTEAPSTTIVISQLYGAGGNAGATLRNDFVELFNLSTSPQSLNGLSLQYGSSSGNFASTAGNLFVLPNVTLQPGQYYLFAGNSAGANGATFTADGSQSGFSMAAGAGKVALVSSTTALNCGGTGSTCSAGQLASIVDAVAYGAQTGTYTGEGGTQAPALSATTAAIRDDNGCTDTDSNSADFTAVTPAPRNTGSPLAPCGAATPALTINDISQDEGNSGQTSFTFTVTLSPANTTQTVTVGYATANGTTNPATGGADCTTPGVDYITTSGTLTFVANDTSEQLTVQVCGDTTTEANETFFVNLSGATNATIGDAQGLGTIQNDEISITPINQIQGSLNASPIVGATVTTTGIVTGRKTNGFFIQDPAPDSDPNTSEAIFIFTNSAPSAAITVGDSVRVTGTVAEFEPATTQDPDGVTPIPDPKTATELTSPTTVVLSSGNTLPAALDADSLNIFNPAALSRGAELEKYEFMRVSVPSITVGQPSNDFGEFWGVRTGVPRAFREPGIERGDPIPAADEGPHAGSAPPNVPVWDGNFERILVDSDDATSTANARRAPIVVTTGAVVTNVVGPLDFVHIFGVGNYRIMLDFTAAPGVTPGMTAAVPVPTPTTQEFTVAHANLENFSSSNATKLSKASLAVRNVLRTPDVLGLIEVDTAASAQALANAVNTAVGDPLAVNYQVYFNDIAGSTQDIGYLVNTARVTVNGSATPYHQGTTFTYCGTSDTLHDRPSLVLSVNAPQAGGGTFPVTVILNHTKSLIEVDSPAPFAGTCMGGTQGARNREKRRLQAEDIADLIQSHINDNLVVLGDLNAFDFNDGLGDVTGTFKGVPAPANQVVEPSTDRWTYTLTNLLTKLPATEHYSLLFEGSAQALDHLLVNNKMLARNTRFAYARYNADFSDSFATDSTRPERVADHDSPVAFFSTLAAQPSGALIISEFRFRGPAGIEDEFIELYNNTDSDITVSTDDGSVGWALAASDGQTRFIIPNDTVIGARRRFLAVNSDGYTLDAYSLGADTILRPDGVTVAGGYNIDIPDGSGIALFATSNPSNFLEVARLDAAGYTSAPELYREGAGLLLGGAEIGGDLEYSWLRQMCAFVNGVGCTTPGTPKDTGANATDYISVDTEGMLQSLGAPGPEWSGSPFTRNSDFGFTLLDTGRSASQPPNRDRDFTPGDPSTASQGTLTIRRTVTNNTGHTISYIAFRIIQITTWPQNPTDADLRAIDSGDITVTLSNGDEVDVRGTFIEQNPPAQPNGGALNSSLAVGYISIDGNTIPDGESFNVQFVLGVMKGGTFRFYINIEAFDESESESQLKRFVRGSGGPSEGSGVRNAPVRR